MSTFQKWLESMDLTQQKNVIKKVFYISFICCKFVCRCRNILLLISNIKASINIYLLFRAPIMFDENLMMIY